MAAFKWETIPRPFRIGKACPKNHSKRNKTFQDGFNYPLLKDKNGSRQALEEKRKNNRGVKELPAWAAEGWLLQFALCKPTPPLFKSRKKMAKGKHVLWVIKNVGECKIGWLELRHEYNGITCIISSRVISRLRLIQHLINSMKKHYR